jgi:hypothetical protein
MKVRVSRNTSKVRLKFARLPIDQRLIWLGPIFLLVQGKRTPRGEEI